MIGEDFDRMLGSLSIDSPMPKTCHHCQQLFVIDRVVQFCRGKFPAIEADGVQVASWGGLREDACDGEVRGVCLHGKG